MTYSPPPTVETDTLKRLETWRIGHKARSVSIAIDNGYGATCWEVQLTGQGGKSVTAAECNFWAHDGPVPDEFVCVCDGDNDWPGLAAVINAAIDRAEKLGL